MNPVTPRSGGEGRPIVFTANQPEYRPLPALVTDDGDVLSEWELTYAERRAIADGARLRVRQFTFGSLLQPILLTIEGVDPEPPVGITRPDETPDRSPERPLGVPRTDEGFC